jgi:hypothetical protein
VLVDEVFNDSKPVLCQAGARRYRGHSGRRDAVR